MLKDLEARLLASIATADQFSLMRQAGITAESFSHYRQLFTFISQSLETNGKVPRLLDIKETFRLPEAVVRRQEEFQYLLGEFSRLRLAQQIQETLDSTVQAHGEQPQELLGALLSSLMGIQNVSSQTQSSITDHSMVERLERYKKAQSERSGRLRGLPTGLSYFDDEVGLGWLPAELIGLIGRTYIGKSWMLIYFGVMAWQFGATVLFLSPEMSIEETEARFDSLIFAKNDIPIETSDLYRGYAPSEDAHRLAEKIAAKAGWYTYSSVEGGGFDLAAISKLVQLHNPQLVLIDGLPLLGSGAGHRQQVWESIMTLSYGLKNLAIAKQVPLIVSHQATRSAHNTARPPGMHEVAYGDAFGQACDRVLALSRPHVEQGEEELLRVTVQKFRKGRPHYAGIDLAFSPERGKIHEFVPTDITGHGNILDNPEPQGIGDALSIP